MEASNRTRKQPAASRPSRRSDCQRDPAAPSSETQADPRPPEELTVAIRATPLPDPETNPLRARQLAVIVNLLRRAAAQAAEQDATPCDDARPPG